MYFECSQCPRTFHSSGAADQHMNAKNHFAYECRVCDLTWPSLDQRDDHELETHGQYICDDCDRGFNSYNSWKMLRPAPFPAWKHSQSHHHVGTNMTCPLCQKRFATATGVTHHIERGSCPQASGMNRDELYRFVHAKDHGGYITKNLLEWHGSDHYEATAKAWNGSGYGCYFCSRQFGSLVGLNQHLSSPAHQQALYHCPQGGCRKDFKTLAALINHLESETCGFIRFGQVQSGIQGLISGDRLLM